MNETELSEKKTEVRASRKLNTHTTISVVVSEKLFYSSDIIIIIIDVVPKQTVAEFSLYKTISFDSSAQTVIQQVTEQFEVNKI